MAKVRLSRGKLARLQACADERGVIAAAAMDQRGSLAIALGQARGVREQAIAREEMVAFKLAVTRALTPHASAILLDPEYSLDVLGERAPRTGLLLAYERWGYDATTPGRMPDLLPTWSVRRLVEAGADGIKILLYYNPFDAAAINDVKQAWIERIGAECAACEVPFFLEPIGYPLDESDVLGLEFARRKPEIVARSMAEFSKERYGVDVLKVEVPFNMAWVKGSRAHRGGEHAYTREQALGHYRAAAAAAGKPFIYLSAGVDHGIFLEALELAVEAEVPFSGVLCGRATWKGGLKEFVSGGVPALERWLEREGVPNIQAINALLERGARPWHDFYGGLGNIEVLEREGT
jgi:tagatose 1,6-diphosphate aldolase